LSDLPDFYRDAFPDGIGRVHNDEIIGRHAGQDFYLTTEVLTNLNVAESDSIVCICNGNARPL